MSASFREYLKTLEKAGELARVPREVDLRYVSGLIARSEKAVLFESDLRMMPGDRGVLQDDVVVLVSSDRGHRPVGRRGQAFLLEIFLKKYFYYFFYYLYQNIQKFVQLHLFSYPSKLE